MGTENYKLGRGIISIAEFTSGAPGTYTDLGNCPKMEVTVKEEKLEHYSSRSGMRTKDKVVTVEAGYSGTFDLDEISKENLIKYLKGVLSGNKIYGLKNVGAEFAIRFVEDNATGPNFQWDFWKCQIGPSGSLGLITEKNWATMSFTFDGESDTVNHPASEWFDVTALTTTTTTTTTTT